ncbi:hypothetical protein DW974_19635 [Lachnospiraceae bacterium AM48-27BH]|nr:hypothetical protein DW974_19635 [Lachnospiraceae bacterium AM48-27BH]
MTSYETKTLREDRTAAERNHVAIATRRRRRILQAGFFFILVTSDNCSCNSNRTSVRLVA